MQAHKWASDTLFLEIDRCLNILLIQYEEQQDKTNLKKVKLKSESVFIKNAAGDGEVCIFQDWMSPAHKASQVSRPA